MASKQMHAYLEPGRLPAAADLQAAIGRIGMGMKLDGDWTPGGAAGYLPVTLQGEDAGVYIGFDQDALLPATAAALSASQGARSARVTMRWGGDRREELAAHILAAALVQGFDALVLEPERGVRKSLSGLKAHARELFEGTF